MSTVEFHRQAAADARAARDAAPNDEVRLHHSKAWAAHFTAMNHLRLLPHYTAQALGVRAWARRLLAKERDPDVRRKVEAARDAMIRMPDLHREHAERWNEEAVRHTAAALEAMKKIQQQISAPVAAIEMGERAKP